MASCISCGSEYSTARRNLGYNTCLNCGDFAAREVRWCVAPLNKSNYVVISNPDDLKGLNPKRSAD
jgi:predicted  nucleic acid-binding Zn-ribbon protein